MGKAEKLIKDAKKAEDEGKFRMAFNLLQDAAKDDPKNKDTFISMGRICLKEKLDMNNALDFFMKALELDQNNPVIWQHIAETCAGLKRWGQCAKAYEKAIAIKNPKEPDPHFKLAEAYEFAQQPAQAVQAYQRLLKNHPKLAEGWVKMARVFVEGGSWENAKDAAEKALQLEPHNYNAQTILGIALNFKGDFQKAEHIFEVAIRAKPRVAMGWEKLAELYMNMEQKPEALFCYQKAGELGDITGIEMVKELTGQGLQPKKPAIID